MKCRSSPKQIEGPDGRNLQLHFRTRLSLSHFTGGKVEGEQGAEIHVVLIDANTGHVVTSGPESSAKLEVVVLEGDFNNEDNDDWTEEEFDSHVVKEREGKRPLLTGDLSVSLKEGVGTLGELTFTDNSSWIRSRKFRLGLKIASGFCDGIRIREAKTEAFTVKDHRGELYKKHYPPELKDEVWRLEKIGKDGSFHKRLNKYGIFTVEDFLRLVVRDPQKLRKVFADVLVKKAYDNWMHVIEYDGSTITAVYSGNEGVTYSSSPNVASDTNMQFESSCFTTQNEAIRSAQQSLITRNDSTSLALAPTQQTSIGFQPSSHSMEHSGLNIYDDWSGQQDSRCMDDFFSEEEIRLRSHEMLENEDMQHLLRTFTMGGASVSLPEDGYGFPPYMPAPCPDFNLDDERNRSSGKAVVGWLKIKAAMRWGIFVRKKAAERRAAQLVELEE
ncbi:hypothetical protein BHM03_00002399 [Ensete ventricosum]|nr:hypothetical protein BHM03_00002399 [Ensete ventricosum]